MTSVHKTWLTVAGAAALMLAQSAWKGETVKIAWIDPLSGLMAPVGQNQLKSFQFLAEHFNKKQPGRRQVRDHPDRQQAQPAGEPQRAEGGHRPGRALRGAGQRLGRRRAALVDAVTKHNERNPGKEVVYLNYAAVDPDLTNSKCSYWHFRSTPTPR
jgi:branched-chain amino acid transport system substrate-binding protein